MANRYQFKKLRRALAVASVVAALATFPVAAHAQEQIIYSDGYQAVQNVLNYCSRQYDGCYTKVQTAVNVARGVGNWVMQDSMYDQSVQLRYR